jgi:hypothetical protein
MRKLLVRIVIPALALCALAVGVSVAQFPKKAPSDTGTLETMIVASGNVAMDLDVDQLNGAAADSKREALRFQAIADSFFPLLVFNNEVRGAKPGSIGLIPLNSAALPEALSASINQLVVEKIDYNAAFDIVVRDGRSGFVFFNIEGNLYEYDAATQSLQINGGRLLVSEDFAKSLAQPSLAGTVVGNISISAAMRVIEVRKVVNGADESASLPPAAGIASDNPEVLSNGPDVIVGDFPSMQQFGSSGTQVGLAVGTDACNIGNARLNWFRNPSNDHPVIPQNLYRMSGGADNAARFEQIGASWLKHSFSALQNDLCALGCSPAPSSTQLGAGCSDPYNAGLNAGQSSLGSRAWVNPFTGAFPGNSVAINHTGHTHTGTSHRMVVEASDLNVANNPGATYYAESVYVTPHEYAWCVGHPNDCNMFNNASYRRFNVSGTTNFSFSPNGATVRMQPALAAWTGATVTSFRPAPGEDGQGFIAYKVTGPENGLWHYEYALNNQNLDRAIQSFSVPLGCGVTVSNRGFYAPQNHPGSPNDGTGGVGFSNAPWTADQTADAVTWSSETFAQNANANALRWGTVYNFRFDSNRPPETRNATIGFFKTGAPITVAIQAPMPEACNALQMASAVSRKTHGAAGTFDIPLPPNGTPGIECRSGGAGGDHTLVFTFSNDVVSGSAQVTGGTGSISGAPVFSGNTMMVNVTGVPAAQDVTVKLSGVTDTFSQTLSDTAVTMRALMGDTNGNSSVNATDIGQAKSETPNVVSGMNFRSDVIANGALNASDISAIKSMAGTTLP